MRGCKQFYYQCCSPSPQCPHYGRLLLSVVPHSASPRFPSLVVLCVRPTPTSELALYQSRRTMESGSYIISVTRAPTPMSYGSPYTRARRNVSAPLARDVAKKALLYLSQYPLLASLPLATRARAPTHARRLGVASPPTGLQGGRGHLSSSRRNTISRPPECRNHLGDIPSSSRPPDIPEAGHASASELATSSVRRPRGCPARIVAYAIPHQLLLYTSCTTLPATTHCSLVQLPSSFSRPVHPHSSGLPAAPLPSG